ncbi:MAG: DEAD/DEAH box helicase family protein [Gammaproteobacteria bacterium]|nr:DEAD/DEAH box helicase family protein [Gammaproteobacteria bacterium]MDA7971270.1 DEAD/DEAH box helicase family protein [Gammaproteobacteria bacterium]MDA7994717.1 DEAD/DEAH box helicase family protein [Gammaproteobacteria bacterium]MDA8023634.1 DEAD/DEAH box helicase family protein [Gammaproteobacteria bacterium]CAJ2376173.1 MAG: Type I restriction-modification system, restriction subunit R [Arenicellales bacterium IbO2]
MNEAQTRAELIDPVLTAAGWGETPGSHVSREEIAPGRLRGAGGRDKSIIADYVLTYKNQKLAVIEAKRESAEVTEGLAQAKRYAEKLQTPFAFSTNGRGLYRVDMRNGDEREVSGYPTPQELWEAAFGAREAREKYWHGKFAEVPLEQRGGQWTPRYYQHAAIARALDAIASGKNRILLTMATGTGKTAIAFQIAWKLYQSRWNLAAWKAEPDGAQSRRPRILFLADRNILADQAFNEFSAFPEDALVRIKPDEIRSRGRAPTNGSVFFTIFQTFMTGADEDGNPQPSFGDYSPDFFDFIVIDECHRGGADEESRWREIMEHFAPAVQLGLTATPRREDNRDTYRYFGEPVYVYSLKAGINDGFLTPFRVKRYATTIDDYIYDRSDQVLEGTVDDTKVYEEGEFNHSIQIKEREKVRVELFMKEIRQNEKTLVFCATQQHALIVRDFINQVKDSGDPDYCVRVTSDDGEAGEQHLRVFRDNEKTIPTILTSSRKLSTGVDARNVRNIVLMRRVNSMIEFKQIIGRGTRLFDGKDYFTVHDFVRAYEHFSDPEWDGEPEEIAACERCGNTPCTCEVARRGGGAGGAPGGEKRKMVKIQLAEGKERTIQHMTANIFFGSDGKPMSARDFIAQLYGDLPLLFADEDALRKLWSHPNTRQKLLQELAENGYGGAQLAELARLVNCEKSDLFDVLAYVAFALKPISRRERADGSREIIRANYDNYQQREFLDFVLGHYTKQGVGELANEKLPQLLRLKYGSVADARQELGEIDAIRGVFTGFQRHLYGAPPGKGARRD